MECWGTGLKVLDEGQQGLVRQWDPSTRRIKGEDAAVGQWFGRIVCADCQSVRCFKSALNWCFVLFQVPADV